MQKISVCLKEVSKTFGQGEDKVHALKNISLEIHQGEMTMIVGPSGCGKTTLLSVIAGTLACDTGTINVLGNELETSSQDFLTRFRAYNVGFIFQQYHLIPTLTTQENVSIPLLIQGHKKDEAFEKAKEILHAVGLGDKVRKLPKELSGGQQQRVAIARALVHEPPLVICDEPTAALDFDTGIKVMDLLKEIVQNPTRSVILVTHDHRIFKYAERVIEMDDGTIKEIHKNSEIHNNSHRDTL